jgi:hypothetical protein
MKRLFNLFIAVILMGLDKLLNAQVVFSRRMRRAYAKAHDWFDMKLQCQVGALDAATYATTVTDLKIDSDRKNIELAACVDDHSAELKGGEATLVIPRSVPGAVSAAGIADAAFADASTDTQTTITLSSDYLYPIVEPYSDQAETPVAIYQTHARNGIMAHRAKKNYLLSAVLAAKAATDSYADKVVNTTDNELSEADFTAAAVHLTEGGAPESDRYCAIPPSMYGEVKKIPNFISRDKMGDGVTPVKDGIIGMVHGFTVLELPQAQLAKTHIADGTVGVSTDEVATAIFFQKYAVAYAGQKDILVGPQLKANLPGNWYSHWQKYGQIAQADYFCFTVRKAA